MKRKSVSRTRLRIRTTILLAAMFFGILYWIDTASKRNKAAWDAAWNAEAQWEYDQDVVDEINNQLIGELTGEAFANHVEQSIDAALEETASILGDLGMDSSALDSVGDAN